MAPAKAVPETSVLEEAFAAAGPFASQVGFGALAGLVAGSAIRTVGKVAGVAVGALFCGVQAAAYSGFLDVNWGRVERAVMRALDSTGAGGGGGGGGALSADDLSARLSKLQTVLSFNLPGGAGLASGLTFALGGRLGRVMVLTSAVCAAPALGTAHAYTTSRTFRQELEQHAPAVAAALNAAMEHSGARAALLSAAAAARELSMRKPPTLEELRREEARAKLEARLLTGDNKMTPQKEVALARIEKTLVRIEADKRDAKKRAKHEAQEARQKKR